jgi:peptidylprolyl isomerase
MEQGQGLDRRWIILAAFALLAIGIAAAILISRSGGGGSSQASCSKPPGPTASGGKKTKPTVKVPDCEPPEELVVNELEQGTGAVANAGDEVTVQYVGVGFESGKEFDSSWSRNEPFKFTLGEGVIKGWSQGVEGMRVGGRDELIIPPELAYGAAGSPPAIGPNETLIFVIDLLAVKSPASASGK